MEKLVIDGDIAGYLYCALTAAILAASTWLAFRRWGISQPLLALIALDIFMLVVELPSSLNQRVVVVGSESLMVRCGRWYRPIEITLPLSDIEVIYEIVRSRHWLENDTFWLLQNAQFRRKRLALPPLLRRQRGTVADFLNRQGIPVVVHRTLDLADSRE